MTIYPSDLAFVTPDADGILRMNRGTTKQVEIPFPSFVGDVRFFSGLASQVGTGDLLGWEIIPNLPAGTLLRAAYSDGDVGVLSGTNTLQPVLTAGQTLAPTGTVDVDHDHGGSTGNPDSVLDFLEGAGTTRHAGGASHAHPIDPGLVTPRTLDIDPVDLNALTIDPLTLAPQSYGVYLIRFTGVAAPAA